MPVWIFAPDQIRTIEQSANAAGYTYDQMMQDAGREIAARAVAMLEGVPGPRITILIGKGNNGGDGLVAASSLIEKSPGVQVRLYLTDRRTGDPLLDHALEHGAFAAYAEDDRDGRVIKHMTASADLVIDALFGIGIHLPLRDVAQRTLRHVRQALNERASARRSQTLIDPLAPGQVQRPTTRVLAVDCPSGVDTLTGDVDSVTLTADATITFIGAKPGLLTRDAVRYVGHLLIVPLNLPEEVKSEKYADAVLLDNEVVRNSLPARSVDGHKGTYGRVLVIAGSIEMPGAAALAALGAYHAGCGLVQIATPAPVASTLQGRFLEPIWLPVGTPGLDDRLRGAIDAASAVLMGPGMSTSIPATELALEVLEYIRGSRPNTPVVIDADGINILSDTPSWQNHLPKNVVLTPHPGEMARLMQSSTAQVQDNRFDVARHCSEYSSAVTVLKGAHTIIAGPNKRVRVAPFKTDGLSKAGTGDVLTGIIAGLIAQGGTTFDAASAAVYVHGLAAAIAAERAGDAAGNLASDVAAAIPAALARIKSG